MKYNISFRMSLIRLHKNIVNRSLLCKTSFSTVALDNEYTATPNYPPILDLSHEKVLERKKEAEYETIKKVKTIEEKQIKLNMPKYYGFNCYMFDDNRIPYAQLPLIQHITRTHVILRDHLPEYYNKLNVDEPLLKRIKEDVEEVLLTEYKHYRKKHDILNEDIDDIERDRLFTRSLAKNINRVLMNNVTKTCPHLINTQVDFDPRIESSWFAGGMIPTLNVQRIRRGVEWRKHTENEPINRVIQYLGKPILNLRSKLPLAPIIPYSEASNTDFVVPYFKYDPRSVGTLTTHRRITNIPGFWPGDEYEHGILSFQNRSFLINRRYNDPTDPTDTLYRQGILSSFSWLNAHANYLGFNTFNDITYPLVGQSVITNGKMWSFFVYQLNTILNHSKYVTENSKKNVCWTTRELKLFEEINDGKVIGFNDDVLKMLIQYYMNVPEERLGVNMKPYLDDQRVSANYEDDDKRNWLEREYKFLMSNRERHQLFYEVYNWEKIYKIDHKKKPMAARRRPFEINENPGNRTLDNRQPPYIPRAQRPDLPRHKGRYAKEYFP